MIEFNGGLLPNVQYIGKFQTDENWMHFERISSENIIYIIIEGEMFLQLDDKKYHLVKNDVITILPNQRQSGYKGGNCYYYFVHFKHDTFNKIEITNSETENLVTDITQKWLSSRVDECYSDQYIKTYFPVCFKVNDSTIYKFTVYHRECSELLIHKYPYYKLVVSSYTNLLLLELSKAFIDSLRESGMLKKRKCIFRIHTIIAYLNDNYFNQISRYDIEKLTLLNYDYINREFKKNTNLTIMDYLADIRIFHAKNLSVSTNYDFAKIGEMVGYENPYYFSKTFRKKTGKTLTDYVKSHTT